MKKHAAVDLVVLAATCWLLYNMVWMENRPQGLWFVIILSWLIVSEVICQQLSLEGYSSTPEKLRTFFSLKNIALGWKPVMVAFGLAMTLFLFGIVSGNYARNGFVDFVGHRTGYFVYASLQQFLLLYHAARRIISVFGYKPAIAITGLLFALFHYPNLPLVVLTFLAGMVSVWHFNKYKNFFAIALMHAVLGFSISVNLPVCMCVGASYVAKIKSLRTLGPKPQ